MSNNPNEHTERQIAVHEAGHFVFARAHAMGPPVRLFIERDPRGCWRGGSKHAGLDPEQMAFAEANGRPPESAFKPITPAANRERSLADYRSNRTKYLRTMILQILAGAAAEFELAGGRDSITEGDYLLARDYARLLDPNPERGLLDAIFRDAKAQCCGELRRQIEFVADRLLQRRSLGAKECELLWSECCLKEAAHRALNGSWKGRVRDSLLDRGKRAAIGYWRQFAAWRAAGGIRAYFNRN